MKANDLMKTNVGSARSFKRVVLVATCLLDNKSGSIGSLIKEGDFLVHVCPETYHPAMIEYRLLCLLTYSNIQELCIISVEGSPYCITLHFVSDEIRRKFLPHLKITHYTVDKKGVHEISEETIKYSRHLAKLTRLIKDQKKNQ